MRISDWEFRRVLFRSPTGHGINPAAGPLCGPRPCLLWRSSTMPMTSNKLLTILAGGIALAVVSTPAPADPPPWAPAHGHRAKHRAPEVVVVEPPAFYALPVGKTGRASGRERGCPYV